MAANGETLVLWEEDPGRYQAVFRDEEQGWTEPQTIAEVGQNEFADLSMASDGSAIFAVVREVEGQRSIFAALRPPGGAFGPLQRIPTTTESIEGLAIAAGRGGQAVVTWPGFCHPFDPERRDPAYASFLNSLGTFGLPEKVPSSKCETGGLKVAMADSGESVLLIDGSIRRTLGGVRASARPPGGSFERARFISDPAAGGAEIGMDGDGRATAVWNLDAAGTEYSVRPPGGGFASPQRLNAPASAGPLDERGLSVNRRGDSVVVWQSTNTYRLKAAYASGGKRFGPAEKVSPRLPADVLTDVAITVSPNGKALAAWAKTRLGSETRGLYVARRR